MSGVIFDPWIGSKYNYANRFGVRVLVLGESHYAADSPEHEERESLSTFTCETVREWAQEKRHRFFTKVSKVLLGRGNGWIDDAARGEVWEHVAFYNYIQRLVGNDSRIRPSYEMWMEARCPFFEILNQLKPNVILVLGRELAFNLPPFPDNIEVCRVRHPSAQGFNYQECNRLFSDAVLRAQINDKKYM